MTHGDDGNQAALLQQVMQGASDGGGENCWDAMQALLDDTLQETNQIQATQQAQLNQHSEVLQDHDERHDRTDDRLDTLEEQVTGALLRPSGPGLLRRFFNAVVDAIHIVICSPFTILRAINYILGIVEQAIVITVVIGILAWLYTKYIMSLSEA
eukprot:CAMPEP_0181050118 /NCGR_PEP_ID=MMETSP1070-20121207/16350_1 /TAXON_ID=265543 /ORGANISM="Minutocellus polymorphus, Strain NH13" /LENGTH=154 /DNA_ID=CAMNT_0023129051 /DNA_START=19 /DNA_END=483 /DNA_ORIENTATION=+